MDYDELDLIRRAQGGDQDAIAQLLQQHYAPLAGVLRSWGCPPHEVDDIIHDTFVRVLQAMPRYQNRGSFSAWLRRICLNLWRDRARRSTREVPQAPATFEQASIFKEQTGPGDDDTSIAGLLMRLPLEQRTVLTLRFAEDLSLQEIARIVQAPVGTVKSRLHYGLRRLRQLAARKHDSEKGDGDAGNTVQLP